MDNEILEKALDYLKGTQEFVIEQSPEFIRQILIYEKTSTIFGLILSSIALIILIGIAFYCILYHKLDKYGHIELPYTIGGLVSICLLIPITPATVSLTDRLLKIYISPKYFLIDLLINKIK